MLPVQDSESVPTAVITPRRRRTYSVHLSNLALITPGMLSVLNIGSPALKMLSSA